MQRINRYLKKEMLTMEDLIAVELACSGCKELMWRPIQHCFKGHSFCQKCYKIGECCKLCGNEQNGSRSYNIERLVDMMTISCIYKDKGCGKRFPFSKIEQHEKECQTYKFKCPFETILECSFKGLKPQIIFHCLLLHGKFTFVDKNKSEKQISLANLLLPELHSTKRQIGSQLSLTNVHFYCQNDNMFRVNLKLDRRFIRLEASQLELPSEIELPSDFIVNIYNINDQIIMTYRQTCSLSERSDNLNFVRIDLHGLKNCSYFVIDFTKSH